MASDEITLIIDDSEREDKRYWNLRKTSESERKNGEDNFQSSKKENRAEGSSNRREGISIRFNMKEFRDISEEQKKTILRTLIGEASEDRLRGERDRKIYEGNFSREEENKRDNEGDQQSIENSKILFSDRFMPLIALMAFLSGLIVMFLIAGSGPYWY